MALLRHVFFRVSLSLSVVFALRTLSSLAQSIVFTMLSSSFRTIGQRGSSIASRAFSTTPAASSAAEVKSLGVIGAGQMVGTTIQQSFAAFNGFLMRLLGIGHCSGGCPKSWSSSNAGR